MLKPEMSNMPGVGSMTDAFDFMKKMWGSMGTTGTGLPGMVMPTLSVEEINKQIADLKAVEAWLSVNMNMLRATIQALEVQSATLASLQAMGQNFAASMKQDDAASSSGGYSADRPAYKARKEREDGIGSKEEPKTQRRSSPRSKRPASSPPPSPDAAGFSASMADPAAWWNMLQNQFNQAVGSAMASEPPEQPEPPKTGAGRKRRAQPRSGG